MSAYTFHGARADVTVRARKRTVSRADWYALCRILGPTEARYALRRANLRVAA